MKLERNLAVLDLETTGTWIEKDKIIEIAVVKCLTDGSRQTYSRRVNPGMPIPPEVEELTGIRNVDVLNEPPFKVIAEEVLKFIGDSDIGGFNVERFDLPLLEREMFDAGYKFEWQTRTIYDAQKVYHINEKRDLTAAFKFYCQKDLENAHSALADTEATLQILESQVERYGGGSDDLSVLQEFGYRTLTDFFDETRRFRWWNGQLYPMFGKYAKRYSLEEITKRDPRYLDWILNQDFSDKVKSLVRNALKGEFPAPPEQVQA